MNELYGLIGYPVKHSYSAVMHNAAFKELGINAEYRLFEVPPQELEDFLLKDIEVKDIEGRAIRTSQLAGFNITIPHKVRAKEILDRHFSESGKADFTSRCSMVGAINTVARENGNLYYLNTDMIGFQQSLQEDLRFNSKDKKVILIGCGGAGRAVVAGLAWKMLPSKIYICEPNLDAVSSLRIHFDNFSFLEDKIKFIEQREIAKFIPECQLLVNTAPVGIKEGDPPIVNISLLRKDLYIYDVIYNRQTQLIKDALTLGSPAEGGLGMLLRQGVAAFEFWRKIILSKETIEIMRKALLEKLNAG